jgi:copper transport protein
MRASEARVRALRPEGRVRALWPEGRVRTLPPGGRVRALRPGGRMRVLRRFGAGLLGLAAVAIAMLLLAAPASAHAVVIASDPPDGARLAHSPASVRIRFDEPVGLDLGYLRVVDASGQRVDAGVASHPNSDGAAVQVALRSGLGDGSYLASYRVTSADSHPVTGSIRYVVGNGPLVTPTGSSGSASGGAAVSSALAVSHWLSFAGIAVVGGSWLIFTVWPSGRYRLAVRRLVWTGWLVAVAGAVGEFLMQGPYSAGSGLGSALKGTLLDATLHANSGQLLSVRLVLIGVLGFVLSALFAERSRLNWTTELAAIVGVGIVVTYAASGHSESVDPRWLAVLVVSLHLAAMIVWLGGLSVLVTAAVTSWRAERGWVDEPVTLEAVPATPAELAASAQLAGPAGGTAFGGLAEPGRFEQGRFEQGRFEQGRFEQGRFEQGRFEPDEPVPDGAELDDYEPDDYEHDAYEYEPDDTAELAAGLPIFSRVALICVATLAITGTLQAWREIRTVDAIATTRYGQLVLLKVALFGGIVVLGYFTRRALARPAGDSPLSRLRRTLLIEVAVGATVLAATAVLISEPPGNVALAAQRSKPRQTTVAVTAKSNAVVQVEPGVHGPVQITIALTGGIKPTTVTASASLPAKDLGPIPLKLQAAGSSSYTASGVLLPSAGTWQIQVTVQTSEFDSTTAVAKLKLY